VSIISEPSLGKVSSERIANQRDCGGQIAEHQLCADADDAEARAAELQITAGVRAALARVDGAIDFNDELDGGSEEVSDESGDWHLAAERNAELRSLERGPEKRFRFGLAAAMMTSEELETTSGNAFLLPFGWSLFRRASRRLLAKRWPL
jgi:ABC-type sugar transport system substrate-binding protein